MPGNFFPMARNNRSENSSGPRKGRGGRNDERRGGKSASKFSSTDPKKEFKKKSGDQSTSFGGGQRKKTSPFYKDRGYGSANRDSKSPKKFDEQDSPTGAKRDFDPTKSSSERRRKPSPFYKDRGYGASGRGEASGRKKFDNRKDQADSPPQKKSPGEEKSRKSFVESRLDKQRRSRSIAPDTEAPKDDLIRLNKYISNSGVCSRREADNLIAMGLVSVNGTTITELGYKVKQSDDVRYDGKKLKAEKPVYILLNKPKGYITTTDDPQERNTVMKLIEGACKERVYPVGRLDRNTSGLLLLTNDGELTDKLSHPRNNVKKIYKAELNKPLTKADFQKILDGVHLEEGRAMVDDLAIVSDDGKTVGLEIHIGWNRIIRRIFETLGYDVVKLDRSVYAGLDKKDLSRGHWRFLRQDEVIRLKHFQ